MTHIVSLLPGSADEFILMSFWTLTKKLRKHSWGGGMKKEEEKAVWKKLAYTIWRVLESEQGTDWSGCVRKMQGGVQEEEKNGKCGDRKVVTKWLSKGRK